MIVRRALPALLAAALAAPAFAAPAFAADTTKAQPTLPVEPLTIVTRDGARHQFHVEMALTPDQQEVGLMFRPTVAPDGGMLFDWHETRESQMWMHNTVAPLDMLFIKQDGVVGHVAEDAVPYSLAVIDGVVPVRATLELAAGTARRLNIRVGDRVEQRIFGSGG